MVYKVSIVHVQINGHGCLQVLGATDEVKGDMFGSDSETGVCQWVVTVTTGFGALLERIRKSM